MKTYWFLGPTPFKSDKTIPSIIWSNLRAAQSHADRPLTRQEILSLIKRMKDKKLFETNQESDKLFAQFITNMKYYKLLSDEKAGDLLPVERKDT